MATSMEGDAIERAAAIGAWLHAELDPGAAFSAGQLESLTAAWMASVFRVPTSEMGLSEDATTQSADDVRDYLLSGMPGVRHASLEAVATGVASAMHSPEWFDRILSTIDASPLHRFEEARQFLRDTPQLRSWTRSTVVVARQVGSGMSVRQQQRLGPLSRPSLAVRAGTLGWVVSTLEFLAPQVERREDG